MIMNVTALWKHQHFLWILVTIISCCILSCVMVDVVTLYIALGTEQQVWQSIIAEAKSFVFWLIVMSIVDPCLHPQKRHCIVIPNRMFSGMNVHNGIVAGRFLRLPWWSLAPGFHALGYLLPSPWMWVALSDFLLRSRRMGEVAEHYDFCLPRALSLLSSLSLSCWPALALVCLP